MLAPDFRNKRATASSAKGTPKLPTREHLQALRQAVAGLSPLWPGWKVFGRVACHAPAGDFANGKSPSDITVWGQLELEWLAKASTAQAIAGLLWLPPWATEQECWLFRPRMR